MSGTTFFDKKKCKDLELIHKKAVYKTTRRQFKKLEEIVHKLQPLFPDVTLQSEDEVCEYCYSMLSDKIAESNAALSETPEDSPCVISASSSSSLFSNNVFDHSYVPQSNSEDIMECNEELGLYTSSISPLKNLKEVDPRRRVFYAARKRKEILELHDSQLSSKIKKLYKIAEDEEIDFFKPDLSNCELCMNWFENFSKSLKNCSSFSEKLRLLSAAPICEMSKNIILSKWPDVTDYMVRKARKIVEDKGNYNSPDPYLGHPIDENVQKVVLEYYLNDDLNCSTQSPNKKDTINIYENGEKIVKVKRFMSRSLHETYEIFKRDHPDMKIGHSKFYTLRPKWVIQSPTQRVCLCIYCTNFELLLVGLNNCLNRFGIVVPNVRETILSAAVCSVENDFCIFKECKKCPGVKGIIEKMTIFLEERVQEEITFAVWEGNDLIKKPLQ